MTTVIIEHVLMRVESNALRVATERIYLESDENPIERAQDAYPGSYAHSTSWRWDGKSVILTYAHVFAEWAALPVGLASTTFDAHDIEQHAVVCHAVRHLHFLERTDSDVAAMEGFAAFWDFSAHVARHHHPAVAGLLPI